MGNGFFKLMFSDSFIKSICDIVKSCTDSSDKYLAMIRGGKQICSSGYVKHDCPYLSNEFYKENKHGGEIGFFLCSYYPNYNKEETSS